MIDLSFIDPSIEKCLKDFGFDKIPFQELSRQIEEEGYDEDRNRLTSEIELLPPGAITELPEPGNSLARSLIDLGQEAIKSGRVGVVILNGGMATRFGGVVKGTVEVLNGRSFLDLKLSQVAVAGGGRVPVLLMNSFATSTFTQDHLSQLSTSVDVRQFNQMASLRITKKGELFLDADGKPSMHATGHGDLPFALRESGELDRFIGMGGQILTVSNVDNLGASLNPLVIGAHIEHGNPMTVELVDTFKGDVGGSPALVDGKISIIETLRLPKSCKLAFPSFNTNTFVFDANALKSDWELDWFAVVKKVMDREAIQFERLVGQLSEYMEVTWLRVPREGEQSRFIPIKTPEDLDRNEELLTRVLGSQGVL